MPMGVYPHKCRPLGERFWSHVDVRGPDECWPWLANRTPKGYGRFKATLTGQPLSQYAHRVAWFLTHEGTGPGALIVCHSCDNPPCCNPAHLWLGTQQDNIADMQAKGREARGLRSGRYTHPERTARGKRIKHRATDIVEGVNS